ncbi:MAG: transketolase [Hyphomicrobium sp.]
MEKANSGHPGMPMGMADVATVLYTRYLKYDPTDPHWPDRDRFILSAGHGSMLLYSLLYLTGYEAMTLDQIKQFRQLHSITPGHPENVHTPGIETTTGPLGQGVATSVGFALAERMLAAEFGDDIVDHHTFVICSDGDLMEGVSQEAIALAGHLALNKLIFLYDDNGISIDGPLTLSDSVDQVKRFQAANWNAMHVDGLDQDAVAAAIDVALKSDKPTLIACKTIIGYGAPHKQGTSKAHGEALGAEELLEPRRRSAGNTAPFIIPDDVLSEWRAAGARSKSAHADWQKRYAAKDAGLRAEFDRRLARQRPAALREAIAALKTKLAAEKAVAGDSQGERTRARVRDGGDARADPRSADLTPSNNTKTKNLIDIKPGSYGGRYIHFGIREHGMAAAMNGMSLHGGFQPAGGTFFVFTDYARPAMRIAALAEIPVVYVMTHDFDRPRRGWSDPPAGSSISPRSAPSPNMRLFRPGDAMETAECWQLALERIDGPTVLALTRQNLAASRFAADQANLCAQGAYEISPADGKALAHDLRQRLRGRARHQRAEAAQDRGIAARVVSVPSLELFLEQPEDYRRKVIGDPPIKIAVEAAVRFGWDAIIGFRRPLCRHARLRRERALQGPLQEFRDHGRGGSGCRRQAAQRLTSR